MNRLEHATSPYLLQHRNNPVDWYPWGEEAFAAARDGNKPIFLSVGYSTCHWCHVMARESFSDAAVAAILNRYFISVKVDREERPDVDHVYMTYVQATTGGGGWPMSVWLTPDLKPFFGGTYFPPRGAYGRPGFADILERVAEAWEEDSRGILETSSKAMAQLRDFSAAAGEGTGGTPDREVARYALETFRQRFDARNGGFGDAPKFPTPAVMDFLWLQAQGAEGEWAEAALEMGAATLRAIARGGIHDVVGGGFHRYAVDAEWRIPHYEKMLYDQAQLVKVFLGAYALRKEEVFRRVALDTLAYVKRDMTHEEGGFFSAEDADSLPSHGDARKREGAFYVWTQAELEALLGEEAPEFMQAFGVEPGGNAPAGTDPHGELEGTNTLRQVEGWREQWRGALTTLREARERRPRPHLDDKILASWNGMMISAFARAYGVTGDRAYLEAAEKASVFLHRRLWDAERKVLLRSFRGGRAEIEGFATDYAQVIEGLLDLYEAGFDIRWLRWADELQVQMDARFLDTERGGYYDTTGEDASVLLRTKDAYDGAEPSANSTAAGNLIRLATMCGAPGLRERAAGVFQAFADSLERMPTATPAMLVALDAWHTPPRQVVVAGDPESEDTQRLLEVVRARPRPHRVVLLADGGEGQAWLAERNPFFGDLAPVEGRATLYLCENFVCEWPVNEIDAAAGLL